MIRKKKELKFYWETQRTETPEASIPNFYPEMKINKTIPVHVSDNGDELVVRAELSGFKKSDIHLNVTDSFVEINASKRLERVEKTGKSIIQERKTNALRRAFSLPAKIDPDEAAATLENGVLTIVMPKFSDRKKGRQVDVK